MPDTRIKYVTCLIVGMSYCTHSFIAASTAVGCKYMDCIANDLSVVILNVFLYWLCNYCESNSEELLIHLCTLIRTTLTIYHWQSIDVCLSAVVCEDDETEVRSRWQFTETEDCTELIGGIADVYSEGFRSECQWALNLNELPHSVEKAYVTECFDLKNGTKKFHAKMCCKGASCQL